VNSALTPLDESGQRVARVKTKAKIDYTYDGEMTADIWNGPSFAFVPKAHGVEVQFLPWHRAWSHSFTLAALLGLITSVLFGSFQAGLVAFLGMSAHVVEDQLGYLGSNLFWPITKERSAGARLLHSGDAIPNFLAVWTALVLILFNLDRFSAPVQNRDPVRLSDLFHDDVDRARVDLDWRLCVGPAQSPGAARGGAAGRHRGRVERDGRGMGNAEFGMSCCAFTRRCHAGGTRRHDQ
jgi:hypothetical protein